MSSLMKGEVLFDAADVGNLLQIAVELLIGDYRHELAVVVAAFILVEDFQSRRKQRHHYLCVGLLAVGDYPQATVKHLLYVIDTQVGEVDVCQPGEAGEDEDVAHLLQAFACELFLHHLTQLVFGKIATVNTLDGDFVAVEGVNGDKSGADCLVDYLLEELHALVGRILRILVLRAKEELQIHDELILYLTKWDVGNVVFLLHELHHTAVHPLILMIGGICFTETHELLGVLQVLLIEFEERLLALGDAHVGVAHHFYSDI